MVGGLGILRSWGLFVREVWLSIHEKVEDFLELARMPERDSIPPQKKTENHCDGLLIGIYIYIYYIYIDSIHKICSYCWLKDLLNPCDG